MLRDNLFFFFIAFVVSFMVGGFLTSMALDPVRMEDNGIYAAPSKQAVYIGGEACTINMTADRVNQYDLARDFEFCKNQHMKLYKDHRP